MENITRYISKNYSFWHHNFRQNPSLSRFRIDKRENRLKAAPPDPVILDAVRIQGHNELKSTWTERTGQ
jgi:hypothetical protein